VAWAFGPEVSVMRPKFQPRLCRKGGVGCFSREFPRISLMVLMLMVGYQAFFVRFCALLLRILAFRREG
jgi:hypothetical protein